MIKKSTFDMCYDLSSGTLTKLNKNEPVSLDVLMRICDFLIVILEMYVNLSKKSSRYGIKWDRIFFTV